MSARGLVLQRSLRKVGSHGPGAQKYPLGNGWLEDGLAQITPREGEAVRGLRGLSQYTLSLTVWTHLTGSYAGKPPHTSSL